MRRLVPLLSLVLSLSLSAATWTTHGPHRGSVNVVVNSAANPRVLYAADSQGVFRSDDGGDTWRPAGDFRDVKLLVADPRNANVAYLATSDFSNAKIMKTTDGGATWIALTNGVTSLRARALLIDPSNPDTLYAGSTCEPIAKTGDAQAAPFDGAIFKSTDAGASWQRVTPKAGGGFYSCVEDMTLDPASPSHVFSRMDHFQQPELASYDAAANWTTPPSAVPTRDVTPDVRYPLTRYGITTGGFLRSEDGGFTWSVVAANGLPSGATYYALDADPANGRLYLATSVGLFRSGDGGNGWLPVAGVPQINIVSMAFNAVDATIVVATPQGLFRIANPPAGPVTALDIGDVSTSPAIIGTDPKRPNIVYAQTSDYFMGVVQNRYFRSTDSGNSWEQFAPPAHDASLRAIGSEGDLYAVSNDRQHLYFREFGGEQWFELYTPLREIRFLTVDRHVGGHLYIAGFGGPPRAYRSLDNGNTWQPITSPNPLFIFTVDPSNGTTLYADGNQLFMKSTDAGMTWQTLDTQFGATFRFAAAPSDPNVLYRLVRDSSLAEFVLSLWRSEDGGQTWTSLPLPADAFGTYLVVHPKRPRTLFLAGGFRVYQSDDGGESWRDISTGLPDNNINSLEVDDAGRALHLGTIGAGVWDLALVTRQRAVRR